MAKYIYILETGQLSKIDNKFYFSDKEAFSTMRKVILEAKKRIDVNKGTDLVVEDIHAFGHTEVKNTRMTYNCMSTSYGGETPKPMTNRFIIRKLKIQ